MFKLRSSFKPTGDQPKAIKSLIDGVGDGRKDQVLLGVTGSGKTFTVANVIESLQLPALIISHNKTLAGQLYQEMRDFFPQNAVSYFVSYYDYYQPEAYLPQTDTYIEKEADINQLIDKLRLQATTNILTRKDVVVVASVSCIYNIGSPIEYGNFILRLKIGDKFDLEAACKRLAELRYERSEFEFKRGSFRVRDDRLDVYPAYEDFGFRIFWSSNTSEKDKKIKKIVKFEPISGKLIADSKTPIDNLVIYPAKHYLTDPQVFTNVEQKIRDDLTVEVNQLKKEGKMIEADRLTRRVNYDLEMIKEVGYVNGIENYSRYFDGRSPGDPPYTLVDYFKQSYGDDFLVFVDESHMTVPQIRGMFNGDYSRKKILTSFGFRLKATFDNRPLKFDEFYPLPPHIIYTSATPAPWELNKVVKPVEQLVRPTGIPDPKVTIKPSKTEVVDLIREIEKRVKLNEKILVTTLTKRIAEDLTAYLKEKKIRAEYLHSEIQTLERSDVLDNLRLNKFDVLIGINLLREGLDLPEVSLVAILDADKEGFLRSKTALIQTMGRAARNINGEVIIYADKITTSIKAAVNEINRRRAYQLRYNKKHHIKPKTISKPIRGKIIDQEYDQLLADSGTLVYDAKIIDQINPHSLTPYDRKKLTKKLRTEMKKQANDLNFELAIKIRDKIKELIN